MYAKLENTTPPHNKEYHIDVREGIATLGTGNVVIRWGRIGSSLQERTYNFPSYQDAINFAQEKVEEKFQHGYHVVEHDRESFGVLVSDTEIFGGTMEDLPERHPTRVRVEGHVRRRRRPFAVRTHIRRAPRYNLKGELIGGKRRCRS